MEGASEIRALRRGFLRISTSQMLACTWVASVLTEPGRRHPGISLRLTDGAWPTMQLHGCVMVT